MAHGCYELLWLRMLLEESSFKKCGPMNLHCDSTPVINNGKNLAYHEQTEHGVDCYFIRED